MLYMGNTPNPKIRGNLGEGIYMNGPPPCGRGTGPIRLSPKGNLSQALVNDGREVNDHALQWSINLVMVW